jgi:hypothetical protein
MISLLKSEVPAYLKKSDFFRALEDDEDERISIPAGNLKFDTTVNNDEDATHLLSTLRYWCLTDVVPELVKYSIASDAENSRGCESVFLPFVTDFAYVNVLLTLQRDASPSNRILAALCSGEVDIVQCLVGEGYSLPETACDTAAAGNHLLVLKYLHVEEACNCTVKTSLMAARKGSLDCLKYLLDAGFVGLEVCAAAAANGELECLRCAHTHGCGLCTCVLLPTTENNHFDCFVYCYENRLENNCSFGIHFECIALGRAEMFKYAVDHGCEVDYTVAKYCARDGRLDLFIYAHEHGMELTTTVLRDVAMFGRLEMLIYCHEQGGPWDDVVCTCAAEAGHFECLRYAVEHGCPYDRYRLCDAAQTSEAEDMIAYAQQLEEFEVDE